MRNSLYLIAYFICLLCVPASSQIIRGEFFFDTDPGVGQGISASFVSGDIVSINDSFEANFTPGLHWVYVRVQGTNQIWSGTRRQLFYVIDPVTQLVENEIAAAEYFFDTDPGAGNGNPLSITPGQSINIIDNININLDLGLHWFYLRTQGQNGIWSNYRRIPVYVHSPSSAFEIVAAEYYLDVDPGFGNGNPIEITPDFQVNASFDLINPFDSGSHNVYVRVRSASGIWSEIASGTFEHCESYGPTASYNVSVQGNYAIFQNQSTGQNSSLWEFGDGSPQFGANSPAHTFAETGEYNVCLYTENNCGTSSHCQNVVVSGLQNVSPQQGQPNGIYYLTASGVGLVSGDQLKLQHSNGTEIIPEYTNLLPSNQLRSRFTFSNAPLGSYDLILISNNGNDTLSSAFLIGTPVASTASFSMTGRNTVRTNFLNTQLLNISNPGNENMLMVPVLVSFPEDINVTIPMNYYNDPLVPTEYQNYSQNHIYPYTDPEGNSRKFALLGIPNVPPGGSIDVPIVITSSSEGCHEIYYSQWVQKYPDGPPDVSCNFLSGGAQCALSLLGLVPVLGCGAATFNLTCTVQNMIGSGEAGVLDLLSNFGGTVADCLVDLVPEAAFAQVLEKLDKATDLYSAGSLCSDYMLNWELESGFKTVCFSGSYDPNAKDGIQGQTPENYVNDHDALSYVISAENLETATAPAALVIIRDTLDANYYDLNSVVLESVQIADTLLHFHTTETNFVRDLYWPINGVESIIRYNYNYDPSNGVMTHRFETLLMENYEFPEDPSIGFLPPNLNSPEGEMFIHFTADPADNIEHLDDIYNKAYIYFDNNDVIITNEYRNVIDTIAPVSTILPLPATQVEENIVLHLEGSDEHALLKDYVVQMSVNNGAWTNVATAINVDSIVVIGELGNQYRFKVRARDFANNFEAEHELPDAEVSIVTNLAELHNGSLKAYPNPVQTELIIELPVVKQDATLHIFDAMGRLVYTASVGHLNKIQIPMEQLPSGLYQVVYKTTGITLSSKVVRE